MKINNTEIKTYNDLYSLSDLYAACYTPSNKHPVDWARDESDSTIRALELIMGRSRHQGQPFLTVQANGEVWGTALVLMNYALFIDPIAQVQVHQALTAV